MATQTNPDGFTYDPVTGTPVDKPTADNAAARWRQIDAKATNAEKGSADALATLGAVRQETTEAKTAAQQSAASSSASAAASNAAADTVERFGDDVELLKQMAEITPGSVTDAQTAILIQDQQSETHARLNAQTVVEGSAFADISKHPGVDPTGATECAAAIQNALDAIGASGERAYAKGIFRVASTVTFVGPVDFTDAEFRYYGNAIAAQVGNPTSLVFRTEYRLPKIRNMNKSGQGWSSVAGSVGVRLTNLYSCTVTIPRVRDFETGVLGHGQSPNGTSYTVIHMDHSDNCKIGISLAPQNSGAKATSGWFNQNTFLGGRVSHDSNEGLSVAGTRNILIAACANDVNNNVFLNTSIETPAVAEYQIECHGQYNFFEHCRYENTAGKAARKVWWRATSKGNVINGGFNSGQLTEINETGAANELRSDQTSRYLGGGPSDPLMLLENLGSSGAALLRGMPAGSTASNASPLTAWTMNMTSQALQGKRTGDAAPRVEVDFTNGTLKAGDGTAAPTKGFGVVANMHTLSGAVTQTTAPAGGTASAPPATPKGYLQVLVGSTVAYLPYY